MPSRTKPQTLGIDKVSVHDALTRLRAFAANWDGYGADPPDPQILGAIANFIDLMPADAEPTPQVVPMTRGRVQLEWHRGARSLELEFESPNTVRYLKRDDSQGIEDEHVLAAGDFSGLTALLAWFAAD